MSERIARKVAEWETQVLPPFPRRRALYRLMLPPVFVALVGLGVAGVVTGERWPLWLGVVVGVYSLAHLYAEDRYGVICETADHWVGDGEMPEGMTQVCPFCRDIPFRELWRGGRR